MNTPAHLIFGAAAFGRRGDARRTWAAILGSLAPDLSLYLMTGISIYVINIPARRVFGELYYTDVWQQVFAIDNSFVLWGIGLAVALWARSGWALAFTGAAILHLLLDFPLHNKDARMHFWPLSDWKFVSPISYWDRAFHGAAVGRIEAAAVVALGVLLLVRHRSWWARAGIAAIAAAEIAPFVMWSFMI